MFIHTRKSKKNKKVIEKSQEKKIEQSFNFQEKIETIEPFIIQPSQKKKNNKKSNSIPVVEKISAIVEEKKEETTDLSEWFEEENIEE